VRSPADLRAAVETYLDDLALTPELGSLAEPVHYAVDGGKRIRAVICLATAEAADGDADVALPAAAALELVHAFSLVHDDLPALDDDSMRRGRPSVWARYGEATAILAGDALLAEAFRLALSYPHADVGRELAWATIGMIGGQQLDLTGAADEAPVHALKTGRLFEAAVRCGLAAARVAEPDQASWRAFAVEVGPLFQLVDDVIDGDGAVLVHGNDGARRLADEAAERARTRLAAIDADTSVLAEVVDGLAARTS
jgi:geranylgeranyl diphosphate synthase type II